MDFIYKKPGNLFGSKEKTNVTQKRIFLLVIFLLILAGIAEFAYYRADSNRVRKVMESEKIYHDALLKKIIDFKSQSLIAYTNDYTYWDEMVNFIYKKDSSWAKEMIDPSLATYGADYVWVFDSSAALVYHSKNSSSVSAASDIFTLKMLNAIRNGNRSAHFFIPLGNDIIEISEATIHPTSDIEKKTFPKGYYVAGRYWTERYLNDLSQLLGSELSLKTDLKIDTVNNGVNESEFYTNSFTDLKDNYGNTVKSVMLHKEYENFRTISEQYESQLYILNIIIFTVLLITSAILIYLVNLPLKRLGKALATGNFDHLLPLLYKNNEFGHMARLVKEYFEQNDLLVKEIKERAEAEKMLRLSENDLKKSLHEKEVLLKEIHHRVKNNLQIITSLVKLQAGRITDPSIEIHLNDILNRIRSIAMVHELLYKSSDLSHIGFKDYLEKIINSITLLFNGKTKNIKFNIYSEKVFLTIEKAVPCAIILNELITNSVKHAFGNCSSPQIDISMQKTENHYFLKISDNGCGLPPDFDLSRSDSLGLNLVNTLSKQLEAQIFVNSDEGTHYNFMIPEED